MKKHIEHITYVERRQFSYRDFLEFKVDGIKHKMAHGTFRNKVSKLIKKGEIYLWCYSGLGFYSIKGHKLYKSMTDHHTMVSTKYNNPLYKMLQSLPFDKQSIHDIRLKFKVPRIWKTLSNSELSMNRRSKDITVPMHIHTTENIGIDIKLFVHRTNTVSVIIGCSLLPIRLDIDGIIKFYTLLARIEEQLRIKVNSYSPSDIIIDIPDYKQWIVTMWHFGRDSLHQYTGEKYSTTIGEAQGVFGRIYSKEINGKTRIRVESQEYPKQSVIEAIHSNSELLEKLT
jgi:hypothetical protein